MNPIVLIGAGLLAVNMMKKRGEGSPDSQKPGSPTTEKPNLPGAPTLTIDEIHDRPGQFLDNIKWTFAANNQTGSGKHQSRKEEPITQIIGDYMVVTQTDPTVRPGEKKADVIMVLVKDKQNRTVIAKRIIIGDKQIIDIQ